MQRHVHRHVIGKFDRDHFLAAALNFERAQPTKQADAVLQMHQRIAVDQFGEIEQLIDL